MAHVFCKVYPASKYLTVHPVGNEDILVAEVLEVDGEPSIRVYAAQDGLRVLSFNDLEIIQDNWNWMTSSIQGKERVEIG